MLRAIRALKKTGARFVPQFRSPFTKWIIPRELMYPDVEPNNLQTIFTTGLDISERRSALRSTYTKFSMANNLILALLFLHLFGIDAQASIFGIRLSAIGNVKEILLLASAGITFVSAFYALNSELLDGFIKKLSSIIDDVEQRKLFMIKFYTPKDIYRNAVKYIVDYRGERYSVKIIEGLLLALLSLSHVALVLIAATAVAMVHILMIMDIWANPSIDLFWNRSIVLFVICADATVIVTHILILYVPLRYDNDSLLGELRLLRARDKGAWSKRVKEIYDEYERKRPR